MSDAAERVRAALSHLTQLSEGMQFLDALDAVHELLAEHDAHAAAVAHLKTRLEEEVNANIRHYNDLNDARAALASAREEREADRAAIRALADAAGHCVACRNCVENGCDACHVCTRRAALALPAVARARTNEENL